VRHPGDQASAHQLKGTEHFARRSEREGTVKHEGSVSDLHFNSDVCHTGILS
jgi:hypothetical protein